MRKQTSPTNASSLQVRLPRPSGGAVPMALLPGPSALRRKLQRLDALDLTALLAAAPHAGSIGSPLLGPTRRHALDDAETLLSGLGELDHMLTRRPTLPRVQSGDRGTGQPATLRRPIVQVHQAIDAMGARVAAICEVAGLRSLAAIAACHRWVRCAAVYMAGVSGHVFGKERQRLLNSIAGDAGRLLAALPRFRKWAQAMARAQKAKSILVRAQAATDALETLLPRLQQNAARLLREVVLNPPGGAEVPDPVRYAAEGAFAIWRHYHPELPNLSRNRGGFLVFGDALLGLAVEALGNAPPAWIQASTLDTALRHQVQNFKSASAP